MKKTADQRRANAPNFPLGSQAYVSAEFITTTRPTRKFAEQLLGPFEVIGRPNPNLVTLQLPNYLWGIHPVFPVSQVEPYIPPLNIPNRVPEPPPPVEIERDLEYEVSKILDSKRDRRCWVQANSFRDIMRDNLIVNVMGSFMAINLDIEHLIGYIKVSTVTSHQL